MLPRESIKRTGGDDSSSYSCDRLSCNTTMRTVNSRRTALALGRLSSAVILVMMLSSSLVYCSNVSASIRGSSSSSRQASTSWRSNSMNTSSYASNTSTTVTPRRRRSLRTTQILEQQVLETLYHATSGPKWTINDSWLISSSTSSINNNTACNWFGITCTADGNIEKILLSDNNLDGVVPLHALVRMPHLKVLKLDGNSLTISGSPPEGIGGVGNVDTSVWEGLMFDSLSEEGGQQGITSQLQYIDMSHTDALGGSLSNLFTTTIVRPDESAAAAKTIQFPHLNDLYLSGCQLRGSFPSQNEVELFGRALERWVMDDNGLSGTLPAEFATIAVNLREFSVNGNSLTGEIPYGFGTLYNLRHLGLKGNNLYGTIPLGLRCDGTGSYGGAKQMEKLDLSRQRGVSPTSNVVGLTGDLPSFSQCENLRRLDLSHNQIGGTISEYFLESVDPLVFEGAILNSNLIEGMLPGKPLVRFDADAISIQDNHITSLDESLLCDSSRGGAISAFGCFAVLCEPGTYFPGSGRQEEAGEKCMTCDDSQYWGATSCGVSTATATKPTGPTNDVASSGVDEKAILMQLYDATGGDHWKHKNGWSLGSNVPVCSWDGILCADDKDVVESLVLSSNNLKGSAPTSVFHLPYLKHLVLKDNALFTSSAEPFFRDIGQASILETLDLSSSGLSDLPLVIEEVRSSLTELHLDSNPFNGASIPSNLYSLTNLRILTLDDCELWGKIDSTIYGLSNLVLLSASNNKLEGGLPPEISHLSSLSTLRLRNNSLGGTLPSSFNLLSSLTTLDLSWNRNDGNVGITGPLLEFAELSALTRLDLSHNSFSGPIPDFFLASVDPSTFEYADLSDNLLVASFPIGIKPIFQSVYLQQNKITSIQQICDAALTGSELESFGCDAILCSPGTFNSLGRSRSSKDPCRKCNTNGGAQYFGSVECEIATSLTHRDAIELIYSSCNGPNWEARTNWLSESVSVCQWEGITCSDGDITEISLRSNGLSGTFPTKEVLGALTTLTRLSLEGNPVSFSFSGVKSPGSLTAIELSNTNLESLEGIDIFTGLTEVYASSCGMRGEFPSAILQLSSLERLDISFNECHGTLPSNIGSSLQSMQLLALHHNSFSGSLPSSLGEMRSLRFLQLQANQFVGAIPAAISDMTGLITLNLSDQKSKGGGLTGSLPGFSAMPDLKVLDLSNNYLHSEIPSNFLAMTNINNVDSLDVSSNEIRGELPGSLSRFPLSSMDFADNKITGVAAELCGNNCALVLCAPTTYSESGKQPSESEFCQHCPSTVYWGTTFCGTSPTKPLVSLPDTVLGASLSDVDFLELIYESCGGKKWFNSDKWMSSESHCNWFGSELFDELQVKCCMNSNFLILILFYLAHTSKLLALMEPLYNLSY